MVSGSNLKSRVHAPPFGALGAALLLAALGFGGLAAFWAAAAVLNARRASLATAWAALTVPMRSATYVGVCCCKSRTEIHKAI